VYQWRFQGTKLAGANSNNLVLAAITTNQAGNYELVVTNGFGAITSEVATLTVNPPPPPGRLILLWNVAPGTRSYLNVGSLPNERGLAYNAVTHRLLVPSRSGPRVYVLNADTGADLHELNVASISGGTYALLMIGVADDGAVYAGNLTTAGPTTAFKLYRWANDLPATVPTVAFTGDPGLGNSQRWGDTLDVCGAGTNTQVLLGSRSGSIATVLTTANGITFTPTVINVAGVPAGALGLGVAFGASNTFWGKATSQALRQVGFDLSTGTGNILRTHGSPAIPNAVAPIGVNTALNLIAGIHVASANHLQLYDLTTTNGTPVMVATNNFATDNDNSATGTGAVDFGNHRVYALAANNGIMALTITSSQLARFADITPLPDDRLRLRWSGEPEFVYELQCSSNLADWFPLGWVGGTNGAFEFIDSSATNAAERYYRTRN
jgi:hypothetical protein